MKQDDREAIKERLIDENLRRVFGDMLDERVPDRFQRLMDDLKARRGQPPEDSREPGG